MIWIAATGHERDSMRYDIERNCGQGLIMQPIALEAS